LSLDREFCLSLTGTSNCRPSEGEATALRSAHTDGVVKTEVTSEIISRR
jgi:hypothetical protein